MKVSRLSVFSATAFWAAVSGPALAQNRTQHPECIENAQGEMVCGVLAEAVRKRMEAEERYRKQVADGEVEPGQAPPRPKFRSVYGAFGQSAFVRGGYAFGAHGGGVSGSIDGIVASVGYRRALQPRTSNGLSLETEAVYFRDSGEATVFGVPIEATATGYTGVFAVRWDANPAGVINPYVSAGGGPAYYNVEFSSGGVSVSDGVFVFGYSGRAGLEARVSPRVSLEAGYRYLGATRDGTVGIHSGELGLNYGF